MDKSIGQRVCMARKAKNLTQEQLAEQCELTANMISRIETGHNATKLETLFQICDVLGVGIDYIFYDILSKDSPTHNHIIPQITAILETFDESQQQYILDALLMYVNRFTSKL